ncbi:MAG: lytic transglycosylase domain-containing protein [Arenimonas sp.]|nr:lytic transglycosylase domain-containing protein [Arenimonas sp.]
MLRELAILCLCFAVVPNALAGTIYRCVGADEVPQFSQSKIAGLQCKAVAVNKAFDPQKSSSASVVSAVKEGPVVVDASQQSAKPGDDMPSVKITDKQGTRVSKGTVYKKQVDGVNVYTNLGSKGAGSLHSNYYVIEKCYACGLTNTINFGKIKLNTVAFATEIRDSSQRFGVEEAIVRAIIHAESAFRPNARSHKGAQGLMQLIPATAKRFGVEDAYNPKQNINGGVQYLAFLMKRYKNDLSLASAAYNAGEGAVDRYKGVPPYNETKNYVIRVGQLADRYRKAL